MTALIPLSQGQFAVIDAADYEKVASAGRWYAHTSGKGHYACRTVTLPGGRSQAVYMHKFLTEFSLTDHINGNGLDNRRCNLRSATGSQNNANSGLRSDNTSGYKGVYLHKPGLWRARIKANGVKIHLGYYHSAEDAAAAYDRGAIEAFGKFARLNFPHEVTR